MPILDAISKTVISSYNISLLKIFCAIVNSVEFRLFLRIWFHEFVIRNVNAERASKNNHWRHHGVGNGNYFRQGQWDTGHCQTATFTL